MTVDNQPTSRAYYSASITEFLNADASDVLGMLSKANQFTLLQSQRDAWLEEISILKTALQGLRGAIFLEYSIPRLGKRIDAVLMIGSAIFVLEFKIGDKKFASHAIDQVCDYALDLKNFHESSHECFVAPLLVATGVEASEPKIVLTSQNDKLLVPIECNVEVLRDSIHGVLRCTRGEDIDPAKWASGRYCPTPTIIEAAIALYNNHSVKDISRNDASAINLSTTSDAISRIISASKRDSKKSICFVTGVPGAGKTLVGLNIATKHLDFSSDTHSVFLSGNGPLVLILREALTRDTIQRDKLRGEKTKKSDAMRKVAPFIQNVHHFRDDCLENIAPPREHVVLFDEAQRAWNLPRTASFMRR